MGKAYNPSMGYRAFDVESWRFDVDLGVPGFRSLRPEQACVVQHGRCEEEGDSESDGESLDSEHDGSFQSC